MRVHGNEDRGNHDLPGGGWREKDGEKHNKVGRTVAGSSLEVLQVPLAIADVSVQP
jgi:hypothetical protein